MKTIIEKVKQNPRLKKMVLNLMMHPVKTRPRKWLRFCQFLYLKKGKGSIIYSGVRKDLVPFNIFSIGDCSVIEDFSILNNAVGDIVIGSKSRVGLGNTLIGPVCIGNNVNIAQNVVISGLNHNYENISETIIQQGVTTQPVIIEDDVWIGANSVVLSGIHIHKHCVIGAGSIVTKNIPDYCVAVGNPAKIIKQYDFDLKKWKKI
jgi:acetyltransferase-like isoleucine patch superfamily enzyme